VMVLVALSSRWVLRPVGAALSDVANVTR